MDGWIKLYRKFSDWEWFKISEMVHLFIYLLINANSKDGEWRGVKIKRGQIITGRKILNEKTGISEQTLRTCLNRLENTQELTIKSTNKYSIITICNYEHYQDNKIPTNQQIHRQLTNNQPATNHKQEEEEYNNIKRTRHSAPLNLSPKKKEIIYPFISEIFMTNWNNWKQYKKEEFKFNYKSAISEQKSLTELDNLSNHNEEIAILIIDQSIKKGWKGFFELKDEYKFQKKTKIPSDIPL